jgi:hypothetical protein
MFGNVYGIERQMQASVAERLAAAARLHSRPTPRRTRWEQGNRAVWHIGRLTIVWQER